MDEQSLRRLFSDLPIGQLRYYKTIDSTNTEMLRRLAATPENYSLIVADEQTKGKGRHGRSWFTPAGSALAFSLLYLASANRPRELTNPSASIQRFTALGALGVCEALTNLYSLGPKIKWPNDVLLCKRKVAGVLAETQWSGNALNSVVIGVGINVKPASVPKGKKIRYPATSIEDILDRTISRQHLLHETIKWILFWLPKLGGQEFLTRWESFLAFRDEVIEIQVAQADGEKIIRGEILGLDESGRLKFRLLSGEVVSLPNGEIHLDAGK